MKSTNLRNHLFLEKVIPEGVAFIISDILSDNHARTQAFGSSSELRIEIYLSLSKQVQRMIFETTGQSDTHLLTSRPSGLAIMITDQ